MYEEHNNKSSVEKHKSEKQIENQKSYHITLEIFHISYNIINTIIRI